jgi:hypothetical protein
MSTFKVFVSSPGDVAIERQLAMKAIERINAWFGGQVMLEPLFWEHLALNSAKGDFQENIPEVDRSDLVICVLWSRLGSKLNPERHRRPDGTPYSSGTEYEFEQAIRAFEQRGAPQLMVYRRNDEPRFLASEVRDREPQYHAVNEFFAKWFRDKNQEVFTRAYISYKNADDFDEKFGDQVKHAIKDWLNRNDRGAAAARPKRWWQGTPYMGLRPFDFAQNEIFFGRTSALEALITLLKRRWWEEKCPFVIIFGASGSGKSSLMRAGLLPWLVGSGCIKEVGLWRRALLRPAEQSGDLFTALANVLVQEGALPELLSDGRTVEQIAATLRDEPKVTGELVRAKLAEAAAVWKEKKQLPEQPMTCLALALDQLEEIFTLKRYTADDRRMFFRAVRSLVESGRVWVMATLRSDFFNRCEEIDDLIVMKENGTFHLLPPNEAELGRIIRRPAEAAGLAFEDDVNLGPLDEIIARETMKQRGALPLLEYALTQLYEKGWQRGMLTHQDYADIGGVSGAITSEADRVFARLSEPARSAFDSVLGHLIHLTEEIATARMALRSDLVSHPGAEEFVDSFVEARLLVGDRDSSGAPTVVLAHESLLGHWHRAKEWIALNQPNLRQHGLLRQAMTVWRLHEKSGEYLLARGALLDDANRLQTSYYSASLRAEEKDFIRDSLLRVAQEDFAQSLVTGKGAAGLSERLRLEAPEMRRQVICDALRTGADATCAHVAQLLGESPDDALSGELVKLVCDHPSDEVRRIAATSLVELDRPELFESIMGGAAADDMASRLGPLAEIRAAADSSCQPTSFENLFRRLKAGLRWKISLRAWWIKYRRGVPSLLLLLLPAFFLSAVSSALFKSVPGFFNYAYTQATGSAAIAAFSAVMACGIWGCFIIFAIALYRLVFARQWERKSYFRPAACLLAGAIGGTVSSLTIMLLLSHIVMATSLYQCGWLSEDVGEIVSKIQRDMLWNTLSFWPYMVTGPALGIGLAMMCNGLWASRRLTAFIDHQSSVSSWRDFTALTKGLIRLGLPFCWPIPLVMAAAVLISFQILRHAPVVHPTPGPSPSWHTIFLGGIDPELENVPASPAETSQQADARLEKARTEKIRQWKVSPAGEALSLGFDAATQGFGGFFCVVGMCLGMVMMRHGVTILPRRAE